MSRRLEIEKLTQELDAKGAGLTAPLMVEATKDADAYPELHKYLWGASEAVLAAEARLTRAHRLLIAINVTIGDGVKARQFMHIRGTTGYQPYGTIIRNPDLAAVKLRQLTEDIARARGRLRAFRDVLPETVSAEIDEALEAAETRAAAAIAERAAEPAAA